MRIAADGAPYQNPPVQGPRRQKLHHRVKQQAANSTQAMGGAHPYGTGDTPLIMPLSLATVSDEGSGSVSMAVSDLVPLVTADGAVVAATGPGRWDQLRAAGRI